jgi:hypothetical protein
MWSMPLIWELILSWSSPASAHSEPGGVPLPVNSAMYFSTLNETVRDLSLYLSQ